MRVAGIVRCATTTARPAAAATAVSAMDADIAPGKTRIGERHHRAFVARSVGAVTPRGARTAALAALQGG